MESMGTGYVGRGGWELGDRACCGLGETGQIQHKCFSRIMFASSATLRSTKNNRNTKSPYTDKATAMPFVGQERGTPNTSGIIRCLVCSQVLPSAVDRAPERCRDLTCKSTCSVHLLLRYRIYIVRYKHTYGTHASLRLLYGCCGCPERLFWEPVTHPLRSLDRTARCKRHACSVKLNT